MDTREIKDALEGLLSRITRKEASHSPAAVDMPRLQLNGVVPDFTAETTQGELTFSKWAKGSWVVLFSHPADFTPVCTTEFMGLARLHSELQKRNVKLLGNSVDSVYSHIAWIRSIKDHFGVEIPFPVIADLDQTVARLYGMIHEPSSNTAAVRAMFFIDPERKLRAMIYYPLNVGRNMQEVLRVVDALQMADEKGLAAPADWEPGQPAIVPPPKTAGAAEERMHQKELNVTDWYFSKTTSA